MKLKFPALAEFSFGETLRRSIVVWLLSLRLFTKFPESGMPKWITYPIYVVTFAVDVALIKLVITRFNKRKKSKSD